MRPFLLACLVCAAACGGGDGGDDGGTPDAMTGGAIVRNVACPGSPDATVTTPGLMYSPASVTIPVNGIVRYNLSTGHDVASTTTGVPFSLPLGAQNMCLQFTQARTYTYHCTPHQFSGTVIVQ